MHAARCGTFLCGEHTQKRLVNRNTEDHDRISKAVMEDPQLKESMAPSKMPFDTKRMFWRGFESIIGLAADH